jgi:hypothetical protein
MTKLQLDAATKAGMIHSWATFFLCLEIIGSSCILIFGFYCGNIYSGSFVPAYVFSIGTLAALLAVLKYHLLTGFAYILELTARQKEEV